MNVRAAIRFRLELKSLPKNLRILFRFFVKPAETNPRPVRFNSWTGMATAFSSRFERRNMTMTRTTFLTAALLSGAVAIATPAAAQLGAAGSVVGGASGAASSTMGNANSAAGGMLNGSTTIQPQAGTPAINPSANAGADVGASGAIQTPSTAPVTNRADRATDRAMGAVNTASDRAADTLNTLPNENASVSGQTNAQAGVAGQNIGGDANASADVSSADIANSVTTRAGGLAKDATATSKAAERQETRELNEAAAQAAANANARTGASVN